MFDFSIFTYHPETHLSVLSLFGFRQNAYGLNNSKLFVKTLFLIKNMYFLLKLMNSNEQQKHTNIRQKETVKVHILLRSQKNRSFTEHVKNTFQRFTTNDVWKKTTTGEINQQQSATKNRWSNKNNKMKTGQPWREQLVGNV